MRSERTVSRSDWNSTRHAADILTSFRYLGGIEWFPTAPWKRPPLTVSQTGTFEAKTFLVVNRSVLYMVRGQLLKA